MENQNNWSQCVCDALADFCGALSPCAIPGILEAIKNHEWVKVAWLIIQAGECTAEVEVIIPVLAFAAVTCLFSESGEDLTPAQQEILNREIKKVMDREIEKMKRK